MSLNLTKRQLELITEVLSHYPEIEEVMVFGSRAEGTNSDTSDVDLAVKASQSSVITIAKLKGELEETNIPFFFDVVD